MLFAVLMAVQTTGTDLRGRGALKCENLGLIPATFHVRLSWPMAGLAPMPLGTSFRIKCRHVMRGIFRGLVETLGGHVFVAGLAGFRAHIERGISRPCILLRRLRFAITPAGWPGIQASHQAK